MVYYLIQLLLKLHSSDADQMKQGLLTFMMAMSLELEAKPYQRLLCEQPLQFVSAALQIKVDAD